MTSIPSGGHWPPHPGRPDPRSSFHHRVVRYRAASMQLVLVPGGRLRRYVILHSEALRLALKQPRRREIAPLDAQQPQFRLRLSELWAWGEADARASLRALYQKLNPRPPEDEPDPGQPRISQSLGDVLQLLLDHWPKTQRARVHFARDRTRPDPLFQGSVRNARPQSQNDGHTHS